MAEPSPLEDEVKIRVHCAGICSSDIYRGFENGAYQYPLIMGHELSGEVREKGSKVPEWIKLGDKVSVFPLLPCFSCDYCRMRKFAQCLQYDYYGSRRDGGLCEYMNVKAWNIIKVPPQVSFQNAAALEPISVALHAISKIDFEKDELDIAILGAGFLGLIAIALIKFFRKDALITAIDRNEFKLDLARGLGAQSFLMKGDTFWEGFLQEHRDRYPIVLESCGSPLTFKHSINLCKRLGKVIWLGNISGPLEFSQKEISSVLRKELQIIGAWNSTYDGREASDWTESISMLEQGFSIEPLITKFITLEEIQDELGNLHSHKMGKKYHPSIKVMVNI